MTPRKSSTQWWRSYFDAQYLKEYEPLFAFERDRDYATGTESRTVDTHVAALRQHLGDDPHAPKYIATVRGVGYRLLSNL